MQNQMFVLFCIGILFASEDIITGNGAWRYQFMPELLHLPEGASPIQNGHGLSVVDGNIYFTYQPQHIDSKTQALVRFSLDGTEAELIGSTSLAQGVPHGLRSEYDPKTNETFLYHANNAQIIRKTRLDGSVVWTANISHWQTEYPQYWPIRPTDAVAVPNSNLLLIADGYGSSFVHHFDKYSGKYLNFSFGGSGKSSGDPIKLSVPHNINTDPSKKGTYVITDRSNSRLVWVDVKGKYVSEMSLTAGRGMHLPCDVDYWNDPKSGMVMVVPSLGDPNSRSYPFINGTVGIYGPNHELISRLEVERMIGHLGHQHPHDAVFLPNGDIVICCWSGPSDGKDMGPAKGTISYWKRL